MLKSLFPKGLRGRAILILLFPVIMLQLIVAAIFIQRHFDRVTRQMVANVEPHIRLVLSRISSSADIEDALSRVTPITVPVNMSVSIAPNFSQDSADQREFIDFSGKIVIDNLRSAIPSITSVNLLKNDGSLVEIRASTAHGEAVIAIYRSVVSPSNPHQLLVLMVFGGFIMTLIAYAFLRNQLRPIIKLAHASKAFGQGRNIELAESGATEVREATRAFLDMRDRIEKHFEQRTEMLTNIGHDLRTPLTRLRIGLELLGNSPETRALVSDVKNMTFMVKELMDFTKDTVTERSERISPLKLVEDLAERVSLAGQDIRVVNRADIGPGDRIGARPTALLRAVENLVGNANNYAERCRLTIDCRAGNILFIVEDDGPGIPPDQRNRAIRAFTRLDPARNLDKGSGVGLGLTIALDVAISHGGSLELESSTELGGLKATLSLPLEAPQQLAADDSGKAMEEW